MAEPKLQKEFQRSFILIPVLSILVMAMGVVVFYYHSLKSRTLTANHTTTHMLSLMLAAEIKNAEERLITLASSLEDKLIANEHLQLTLTKHLQNHKCLHEIRIIDSEGYVTKAAPDNPEIMNDDMSGATFVRQARESGNQTWSQSHLNLVNGVPVSPLAVPFSTGMIIAYFDLMSITSVLDEFQTSNGTIITILDEEGVYLYHPDPLKVQQRFIEPYSKDLRQALEDQQNKSVLLERDALLITASKIPRTSWFIAVFQNKKQIIEPILQLSVILLWGCLLSSGIGFLLAIRTSSRYFGYFNRLAANIHDVANGVYERNYPSEGYSELQTIEVDFYRMAQKIKTREGKISNLNAELQKKLKESEIAIRRRREAEHHLRKSHETFTLVLDGINTSIHVTDFETHTILFANKCLREQFGDENIIGKKCWSSLRNEDKPCSICTMGELLDKNGKPGEGKIWQGQNPVTKRWVVNHDRAIRWIDGRYVYLQVATDITELKEMEEKLRQAQKMEAIGTLAGGVAHDFNNILSAIYGYAELAKDDIQPGQTALQMDLDEILKGAQRAKELVQQILAFSRKGSTELKNIKFQHIIIEAVSLLRSTIPTTIDIVTDIDESCPEILADPTELHQIVMNICTNGYHAMRESGGTLTLRLSQLVTTIPIETDYTPMPPGTYVQLKINDTGHGMTEEVMLRIFDPYFTSKGLGEGTGLGLAVVHGIISKYGGHIEVESTPGKGSSFTIVLPRGSDVSGVSTQPDKEPPGLPAGNESILIVDDEESIVNITHRILTNLGYRTTLFQDSSQALDVFSNDPMQFDLMITDMTMPVMTGAELSERILKIRPDLPIILCTGYSDLIDEAKARNIGIRDYLMKPVKAETLTATIRSILNS